MEMTITFPGGKCVDAAFRGFILKTDQPEKNGGSNSAPSPFELFLASIGTCAGFYVASFCEQRNIPTDRIKIIQSLQINSASHTIEKINLDIQLPEDFPKQYKQAVILSAKQCTVKKALENPPEISINTSTAA